MLARIVFVLVVTAASFTSAGVIVERFTASTEQPGTAWIGKALTDALVADLVDLPNTAGMRVIGSYQAINSQVRVNVQLVDSAGTVTAAFRASGSTDDLFHLEDALADSTRALIARAARQRANVAAAASMPAEDRTPTRLVYSGPLQRNLFAKSEPRLTDPHARAATWRYQYSSPLFNWTWSYGGGYYGRGYGCGYRFGGRPAFIFAAYQGGQNTY